MKISAVNAALAFVALTGASFSASADPWKDESGHNRWRSRIERSDDDLGRRYARERRAFKEEYDDSRCKYERKLEKSGEYKEEVKCRGGRRAASPAYGYRY